MWALISVVAVMVSGCAAGPARDTAPIGRASPWTDDGYEGLAYRTPHYCVLSTVADRDVLEKLARLLEAAYAEYAALVPPARTDDKPLDVYFFARPDERDAFTRRLTGAAADVYLRVGAGGFAYGDRVVCWLFNENDLWPTVAHEGFHQYVARHLVQRLPPAIEEGLATTFENVRLGDERVLIDRRRNPRREAGLAAALRENAWRPMDRLVRLHAGDIAGQDWAVREAFYGECWAAARTMLSTPAYANGTRAMLADLRDGRSPVRVGPADDPSAYLPAACRPLLEHYVASDWPRFERAVLVFAESIRDAGREE